MNYFKVKIKIERVCDDGMTRNITEEYLIDALSWSEAEARIIEEMDGQQFTIHDIRPFKVNEAFLGSQEYYFKARLYFLVLDEKSGREKKTAVNMLIQADDIEEAKQILVSEMKKTMIDYTIQKIEETKIMDVFPYKGADDIEEAKQILVSEMKKTMIDYTIQKIEETKIMDVFPYKGKE